MQLEIPTLTDPSEKTLVYTFIPGAPKTAGSKVAMTAVDRNGNPIRRKNGKGFITHVKDSTGDKGKEWRTYVRSAVREIYTDPPVKEPVVLDVTFAFLRPQAHYGTGQFTKHRLKASAPEHKITKPDVSKLTRAVEDAMLKLVYTDDSCVVQIHARKIFAGREGASIHVYRA